MNPDQSGCIILTSPLTKDQTDSDFVRLGSKSGMFWKQMGFPDLHV